MRKIPACIAFWYFDQTEISFDRGTSGVSKHIHQILPRTISRSLENQTSFGLTQLAVLGKSIFQYPKDKTIFLLAIKIKKHSKIFKSSKLCRME